MLLYVPHSPEEFLEQLPVGSNSRLGGDGFKIASKVLCRDPRYGVGGLGQNACRSGRSADNLGKRPFIDFRLLVV